MKPSNYEKFIRGRSIFVVNVSVLLDLRFPMHAANQATNGCTFLAVMIGSGLVGYGIDFLLASLITD